MSTGQEILDAIAAQETVIDSVITFIQHQDNITPEQKTEILEKINADRERLNNAIVTNTPNA